MGRYLLVVGQMAGDMTHVIERLNAFPASQFSAAPPLYLAVKTGQPEFYQIYRLVGASPEEYEYAQRLPVHTFTSKRACDRRIRELSQ